MQKLENAGAFADQLDGKLCRQFEKRQKIRKVITEAGSFYKIQEPSDCN
jgi:hypothetical protein